MQWKEKQRAIRHYLDLIDIRMLSNRSKRFWTLLVCLSVLFLPPAVMMTPWEHSTVEEDPVFFVPDSSGVMASAIVDSSRSQASDNLNYKLKFAFCPARHLAVTFWESFSFFEDNGRVTHCVISSPFPVRAPPIHRCDFAEITDHLSWKLFATCSFWLHCPNLARVESIFIGFSKSMRAHVSWNAISNRL